MTLIDRMLARPSIASRRGNVTVLGLVGRVAIGTMRSKLRTRRELRTIGKVSARERKMHRTDLAMLIQYVRRHALLIAGILLLHSRNRAKRDAADEERHTNWRCSQAKQDAMQMTGEIVEAVERHQLD